MGRSVLGQSSVRPSVPAPIFIPKTNLRREKMKDNQMFNLSFFLLRRKKAADTSFPVSPIFSHTTLYLSQAHTHAHIQVHKHTHKNMHKHTHTHKHANTHAHEHSTIVLFPAQMFQDPTTLIPNQCLSDENKSSKNSPKNLS